MTEPTPQPTLADVLAAVQAIAVTQTEHGAAINSLTEKVDANQLATAARFDLIDARGTEVAQTLEALSAMAYDQQQALGRVEAAVGKVEARLTSRISDVQQVVQNIKADLAAHTSGPEVHDHRSTPPAAG